MGGFPLLPDNITDCLKVFQLLKQDLQDEVLLLGNIQKRSVGRIAVKCLYIDLNSFLDEMKILNDIFVTADVKYYNIINTYLLISHPARKLLNQNRDPLKKIRNSLYGHNHRDNKSNEFIDPMLFILHEFTNTPVFLDEIKILGEAAILVASLAQECFLENRTFAYYSLRDSQLLYERFFPALVTFKDKQQKIIMDEIYKEVYLIKDSLRSNKDNYKIISDKIKCSILPFEKKKRNK